MFRFMLQDPSIEPSHARVSRKALRSTRTFNVREELTGEVNFPVVERLNKGLTAAWSPTCERSSASSLPPPPPLPPPPQRRA
eukprot:6189920-Pyramimonas_sp.AAC.1